MYRDADVEQFITRVVSRASPCSLISDEDLPFSQAIHRIGNGITIARVLAEVLSGRLKPIDTGKRGPLLQRLRLSCQEIARFLDGFHKQRREELGLLTTRETAPSRKLCKEEALRRTPRRMIRKFGWSVHMVKKQIFRCCFAGAHFLSDERAGDAQESRAASEGHRKL